MKQEYQDKIDDYLLGRMSDAECRAFEKDADCNEELQDQLRFSKNLQQALKSRNEKLAAIDEWKKQNDPRHRLVDKRVVYWISSLAAVFVAGLFILQNQAFSHHDLDPIPTLLAEARYRGGTGFAEIDSLLVNEQFDEALVRINEKAGELTIDSSAIINDSFAVEERREYEMKVIKDSQDALKWRTALALIGLDQKEDALLLLKDLKKEKGVYQKQAKSLYRQLRRSL